MYHSKPRSKNKRRKWKNTLAGDTFQTFCPYIDIYGCGEWWQDAPHWSITDEVREAYRNDPTGENAKRYHTGKLKPKRIDQGIQFDDQYYTCARQGLSLLYLDIDDHLDYQQDKADLTTAVVNLLGADYFFQNEGRLWIKAEWHREDYPTFRQVYTAFLDALRIWARSQGFQSDIDTPKGIENWNYGKLETFKQTRHVSITKMKEWTEALKANSSFIPMSAAPARSPREKKVSMPTPCILSCRSMSGLPFNTDDVADVVNCYKSLAYTAMNAQEKVALVPKGQRLYARDIQYALTILHFARLHPNPDGSMPEKRARKWWTRLYQEGIFQRGYDPRKWAAITRLLACCGVTRVVDNNYWYYTDSSDKKGQAMKYHIKEEYMVTDSGEGEASLEDVVLVYHPQLWQPRGQARIYRYFWLDPPDEILSEAA
jgi:hypothetical protein